MIYEGKICKITNEGLHESLFRMHPIWCEYYLPSEIDFLESCGESRDFLEVHLIDRCSASNADNTFYSWPLDCVNIHPEGLPEFAHVASSFEYLGKVWPGFLWLSGGELTGISIFYQGDEIDFSLNEELREENAIAMSDLTLESLDDTLQFKLILGDRVSRFIRVVTVRIPV